jgi:hypothetical protein
MASMNAAASWIRRRGAAVRVSICGSEGSHSKRIYTKYVNSSYIRPTYFFLTGLPLAEKSQICSNVDMSTDLNLSCFPATKETQQISRQTGSRFGLPGHSIWIVRERADYEKIRRD